MKRSTSDKKIPKLEEFLEKRDYTGALTLLEFNNASENTLNSELWMGYCAFHLGDYKRAATIYENLQKRDETPADTSTNLACCYFFLGMYPELMEYHHMLEDVIEDQLSLASIHYLRAHYQEAIDVYKKILLENRL